MRKTKIVITVGPATDSKSKIKKLIKNGVDVFRLNFSHATHDYHKDVIEKIRDASKVLNKEVAILQDISGPKIRICHLKKPMELKVGEILTLSIDKIDEKNKQITLSYPQIIDSLKVGESIYFSDGIIRTKVKSKNKTEVLCEVVIGGTLQSKKGINFPQSKLNIETITPKDEKDIIFGAQNGVDIIALSFVSNKKDILRAKQIQTEHGNDALIFPKIEKPEAVVNLNSILSVSDGVMVARGDLGVEFGLHKVPMVQKKIIQKANELGIPAITATQMLTSMINSPYPTRAEMSDIANAVIDGTDAVMLSDETTVGHYPLEAIEVLKSCIKETEKGYNFHKHLDHINEEESIAAAVTTIAKTISPHALISFTRSGKSAMQLARFRPKQKIIVSSFDIKTIRKMQVVWGITNYIKLEYMTKEAELLKDFFTKALENKTININKKYVLTLGYPLTVTFPSNQIKIVDKNTINYFMDK